MRLRDRIALITGGTSGIGLATAHGLLEEGAQVIITGREGARLRDAALSLGNRARAIAADVADPAGIARLMAAVKADHGHLDILVVNAGVSNAPAVRDLDVVAYDGLMDVNCRGTTFSFVHALPLLADGASVIFVGSVAARKGQPGDALYAGSKGFVRAFARNLGSDPDLLRRQIRVNVVTPGPIDTPLTHAATSNAEVSAYVEGIVPMRRWGHPEEVAKAILFLASDDSSFTTGSEITVDGGMSHA